MKQLDVQWGKPKMPDDVKKYFFNYFRGTDNDVWVEYEVGNSSEINKDGEYIIGEHTILDSWLIENFKVKEGESILLKHWW